MLEHPLLVLPKDAIDFKKVNAPLPPDSTFNPDDGVARFTFYVPVEGHEDKECIQVTLKIHLVDFPPPTADKPWITLSGAVLPK